MKCKLTLINGNWYAENLGETNYLEPYNFLSEGDLYKVIDTGRFTPEEGKEVYVELLPVDEPGDIPCEEVQQECKIISLARDILNNTPPEVKDRVKARANLDVAVDYVIHSQSNDYLGTPYLLLGDVQELIKILTGVEVPLDDLIYQI